MPKLTNTQYKANFSFFLGLAETTLQVDVHKEEQPTTVVLLELFQKIIAQSVQDARIRIFDVDLTSTFSSPPATAGEEYTDECVHHVVDATCAANPLSIAVSAWDGDLTYKELVDTSGRWAHQVATSQPVARPILHCMAQSKSAVVAWLGIMRSGAPCVPLDPNISMDRLEQIAEKTNAEVLLCDSADRHRFRHVTKMIITPEDLRQADTRIDQYPAHKSPSANDDAVIIFTSGSTGEPKGVIQVHRAIARSLRCVSAVLGFNEETRMLQFASHSFDVSICEIFTPFVTGGCVCIPKPHEKLRRIAEHIRAFRVTDAILTPTVANLLSPEAVPSLRHLYLGGEAPSRMLCERWASRLKLHTLYGTTETAVWDTVARVTADKRSDPRIVGTAIGSPVRVTHPDN